MSDVGNAKSPAANPTPGPCPCVMPSRVLIVDDHPIVRMGVRISLAANPKWEVCGEAADGAQALREIGKLAPDVVILDVSMPIMNGFEVAREIRRIAPSTKIVFFSIHDVPATAREVGADGFVLKSSGVEALEKTLETVLQHRLAAGA
jgi:two-component system nitrate/nitrite response regulator NarL